MDLQSLAATVSAQAADLNVYSGFLLTLLDGALPAGNLQVERQSSMMGRFRGKEPDVIAVSALLGENVFALRRARVGAPVEASVQHVVNGIVLSRQVVGLAEWSGRLATSLQRLAEQNAEAAQALARLTGFQV